MGAEFETRVLLADDHQVLRQALKMILERSGGFVVVGEASDGREAVELAAALSPDVVVLDIGMAGLNGIEAARRIAELPTPPRIVALTGRTDDDSVAAMFSAGASGYVRKDCAVENLVEAVRTVMAGRTYTAGTRLYRPGMERVEHDAATASPADILTAREREVLQLIAEGRSTKVIAGMLDVSAKTVETHRKHIIEKTGIDNVAELTKFAIRHGITDLE